jgi:CubicO group peptidase (beta-lactamase class C family)
MSARDLASFGEIFVRGGEAANGARVLSANAVAIMMTPVVDVPSRSFTEQWCVGLELEHWSGTPVYGHAGGNMSGTSYLKIFPEKRGVLAITCNTPAAFGGFSKRIFDAFGPAVFGVERAKLAAPDPPVTLVNPERFIGTYSMYGTTYEVTRADDQLRMKVTMQNPMTEDVTVDYALVPLGDDAFLMEGGTGPTGSVGDVGFFGNDGRGRATNLVAPVFVARRID